MKFNKEVSDLARKLDYIGIEPEDRRRIIKKCVNPLRIVYGFSLIIHINDNYKHLKEEVEKYNELFEENKKLKDGYRDVRKRMYSSMN